MQQPLVSVVIPCYNAEKWIWDCLSSIIKQDLDEIEIIVVNDASIDKSLEVINKFTKLFGGVKVIQNEINLGECKTSAKGFAAATGEYVCRLSADDVFVSSHHLTRQVVEMKLHNLDWCYNSKSVVGEFVEKSPCCQTAWFPLPIRYSANWLYVFDNFLLKFQDLCYVLFVTKCNPINSSAMMIRKSAYDKLLVKWDNGVRSVCDMELVATMLLAHLKVRAIPEVGSFYRIHPSQASNTIASQEHFILIKARLQNRVLTRWYFPFWMKLGIKLMRLL